MREARHVEKTTQCSIFAKVLQTYLSHSKSNSNSKLANHHP